MSLPPGITTSLDAKLNGALGSLDAGHNRAAVNQLNAFINEVDAQSGKKIPLPQAEALTTFAQGIINVIVSS